MYTHYMKTVIRTWGNSLAIRIPKAFAMEIGLNAGKSVNLSLEENGLRIASSENDLYTLLRHVTPENLHRESSTGSVTGREVW